MRSLFARRAAEVDASAEELAVLDLTGFFGRAPTDDEIAEWLDFMPTHYEDLEAGQRYVYFDGLLIPADAAKVVATGWHAAHELPYVPQVAAMTDDRVRDDVLASNAYWSARRVED